MLHIYTNAHICTPSFLILLDSLFCVDMNKCFFPSPSSQCSSHCQWNTLQIIRMIPLMCIFILLLHRIQTIYQNTLAIFFYVSCDDAHVQWVENPSYITNHSNICWKCVHSFYPKKMQFNSLPQNPSICRHSLL